MPSSACATALRKGRVSALNGRAQTAPPFASRHSATKRRPFASGSASTVSVSARAASNQTAGAATGRVGAASDGARPTVSVPPFVRMRVAATDVTSSIARSPVPTFCSTSPPSRRPIRAVPLPSTSTTGPRAVFTLARKGVKASVAETRHVVLKSCVS